MKFTGERYIVCEETAGQLMEREHWQRYILASKLVKPTDTVLDIASGSGYGSDYLSSYAKKVIGIDISEEAIDYSRNTYTRDNLCFLQGDVSDIPVDDHSIDLVVSFETIEHVDGPTQEAFLAEVKRVLKTDGVMVVSCPNIHIASEFQYELWGTRNEFHVKEHTEDSFRSLLEKFFPKVTFLHQRNELSLIIDAPGTKQIVVQWEERKHRDDTQNFIAICAEKQYDPCLFSCMMLDISNQYVKNQKVLAEYVRTVERQNGNIAQLEAAISGNAAELEQRKKEVQDHISLISVLQQGISDNLKELERVRGLVSEQEEANRKLALQFNEFRMDAAALQERSQKEYQELQRKNEEQLFQKKEELSQREEELSQKKEELSQKEELLFSMRQQLLLRTRRIEELETIENSRIWRMSKPLRVLLDFLKGGRRHNE